MKYYLTPVRNYSLTPVYNETQNKNTATGNETQNKNTATGNETQNKNDNTTTDTPYKTIALANNHNLLFFFSSCLIFFMGVFCGVKAKRLKEELSSPVLATRIK